MITNKLDFINPRSNENVNDNVAVDVEVDDDDVIFDVSNDNNKYSLSSLENTIFNICRNMNYYIDKYLIIKFINSGINKLWFYSPHSFLEFAMKRVLEDYKNKPENEIRLLFINAVLKWENLRFEYPKWRDNEIIKFKTNQKETIIQNAKNNIPKGCKCGQKLNNMLCCQKCKSYYEFDEDKPTYIFYEFCNEISFLEQFENRRKNNKN